jgi:hypothetical protein
MVAGRGHRDSGATGKVVRIHIAIRSTKGVRERSRPM